MIVSASYRTDIPAFYGKWFAERWAAGYCDVPNPYSQKLYRVSLLPQDVEAMVFWTRAAKPFRKQFDMVHADGVPFVVTYTLTGYGPQLEKGVPVWQTGAEVMHDLAAQFGKDCVVWRYDPIVVTDTMTHGWHVAHFGQLAEAVAGASNEVVVSFMQFHAKTRRSLMQNRIPALDPSVEEKQALLRELAAIAAAKGMRLSLCAQPDFLIPEVKKASCIDLQRLWRVRGEPFKAKLRPTRPNCACAESRDIGRFATCKFGCAYCYAR
jgi:sugar phosphate isomerase/epimerase